MGRQDLDHYRTTADDINLVIDAVTTHEAMEIGKHRIPLDSHLRVPNCLHIIIDTAEKILLLPPNLPKEAYYQSEQIASRPEWRLVTTPLSEKDRKQWIQGGKLGKHTGWDYGLGIEGGAAEWEGVRRTLANQAVWNPMQAVDDPSRSKILPAIVFTAPIYRYQKKAQSGVRVPIKQELLVTHGHEKNHVNVMAKIQSWPDGHYGDNCLINRNLDFEKIIKKYNLLIPSVIVGIVEEMRASNIAPIGHIHELLAYLAEIVETGIMINEAYLQSASVFLSERNIFGANLAVAIVQQIGIENATKFGNSLIESMIRDRE